MPNVGHFKCSCFLLELSLFIYLKLYVFAERICFLRDYILLA